MAVRRRQLRNAMCLLLLSHGVPMFVAGDEFARTQHGNNNPYNQDNETSWIDWERQAEFAEHERFVERLVAFRREHAVLSDPATGGATGSSGSASTARRTPRTSRVRSRSISLV